MGLCEFKRVFVIPGRITAYQSHTEKSKNLSGSNIVPKIGVVRPVLHYFTNLIEARWIKIVIVNPYIPLLTDGARVSVRMSVKLPAIIM